MIRVGTAGWSYPDWEGVVYPREKPPGFHPLRFLARYVRCVEVNSSFYGVPRPEHARRWAELVADVPEFRFTVKLQNVFTHEPLPASDKELEGPAELWWSGVEPLADAGRLAGVLVQFPISFRWDPAGQRRLERIEALFGHLPLVLEVRHRSWFEPEPLATVERLGYSLARLDLPRFRDHPPPDAASPGPIGYLRVHGRNAKQWFHPQAGRDQRYDYLYGPDELVELTQVARRLAEGRDETYVVTNNHFSGQALANAVELLAMLEGGSPAAPASLVEAFPRLRAVARPDGQPTLF